MGWASKILLFRTEASLRSADVFPVVASLPPKNNGGREATTGNTSALRRLNGSLFCHKKSFQVLSWQKLQRDTPTWTGTINYNCKRFSDYFRTGKLFQIKSNHSSRAIFLKCFKCSYFSTFTDDKIETQCLNFSCPTNYDKIRFLGFEVRVTFLIFIYFICISYLCKVSHRALQTTPCRRLWKRKGRSAGCVFAFFSHAI